VIGGLLFGFGLALSGMTKPEVVLSFLQLEDLGLILVLGGAAGVTMMTMQIMPRLRSSPLLGNDFSVKDTVCDRRTIIGSVIFGIGWGLSGLCPGSAVASVGIGNYPVLVGIGAMFLGAYVHGRFVA
jgi:hypothetical protein